ncbi:MAG: GNAT family N-acetyltransferase [Alphaproteobacteria bacterium]|nr:GNAT family N-acetyltransferase [Alphaproteobacteria bacterium]
MPSVALEDPRELEIRALLAQSDSYSASRYPPESQHQADIGSLTAANVRFFAARSAGAAVGCGALVIGNDGTAELKRMFVDPAARGKGIGQALLQAIEVAAFDEGVRLIRLETGIHNTEALRLYRRFGYVDGGSFGNYRNDPLSVFMEKPLT